MEFNDDTRGFKLSRNLLPDLDYSPLVGAGHEILCIPFVNLNLTFKGDLRKI